MSDDGTRLVNRALDDGRDVDTAFVALGRTGLVAFGGYVQDEWLPALRWPQSARVYREMTDNDPVVGAMLVSTDLLMRKAEFLVKPADDSALALEIGDFCESCLHDMDDSFPDTVSSALSMLPFGFSLLEMIGKRRLGPRGPVPSKHNDGKIGWRQLPIRAQETITNWIYDPDDDTEIIGFHQQTANGFGADLPLAKFLHFRTTALKNNPQGRSVLRNAYRPWFYKRRIEEIEAVGVERDLAGLPYAWAPEHVMTGKDPNSTLIRENLRDAVRNVRRNEAEGLLFPREYDDHGNATYGIELLTTGGRRQFDTGAIVARYDQRILTTMLADFILLGHEGVGSLGFEMGTKKVELFLAALDTWLDQIADEFTRGFRWLVELNGWPPELTPRLHAGSAEKIDVTVITEALVKLSQAGAVVLPDPVLTDWLLDQMGVPHSEPDLAGM